MPYKDPEVRKIKQKEYQHNWYQKNRETHIQRSRINKDRYKKVWDEFKASLKCTHCGVQHPALLDFHHVVRGDKQSVHKLVANGCFAAAKKETEKCIPLCANCHRLLHWEEMQAKKKKRKKIQRSNSPVTSNKTLCTAS